MMPRSCARSALAAGVLLLVLLAGCGGPKMVTVRGKLLKGGEPYKAKKTYVTIMFAPAEEKPGTTYPAKYDPDEGAYKITMPAGKYKVGITVGQPGDDEVYISPMTNSKVYDLNSNQELDLPVGK